MSKKQQFVLATLMLGLGFLIGYWLPEPANNVGDSKTGKAGIAEDSETVPKSVSKKFEITRRYDVEGYLAIVDCVSEPLVFEYSGSDALFWVEVEARGEKKTFYQDNIESYLADAPQPGSKDLVHGSFVFVRSKPTNEGVETWNMCFSRIIAEPSSGNIVMPEVAVWNALSQSVQRGSKASSQDPESPQDRCISSMIYTTEDKDGNVLEEVTLKVFCGTL